MQVHYYMEEIVLKVWVKTELVRLMVIEFFSGLSAFLLYFAWLLILETEFSLIVFYPLAFCGFVLLQGAAYWKICLLRLERKATKDNSTRKIYQTLRYINLFLGILYIPIMFIFKEDGKDLVIGVAFYIFSILEYINYYFVRLSYPPRIFFNRIRKLNFAKSQIAKE